MNRYIFNLNEMNSEELIEILAENDNLTRKQKILILRIIDADPEYSIVKENKKISIYKYNILPTFNSKSESPNSEIKQMNQSLDLKLIHEWVEYNMNNQQEELDSWTDGTHHDRFKKRDQDTVIIVPNNIQKCNKCNRVYPSTSETCPQCGESFLNSSMV